MPIERERRSRPETNDRFKLADRWSIGSTSGDGSVVVAERDGPCVKIAVFTDAERSLAGRAVGAEVALHDRDIAWFTFRARPSATLEQREAAILAGERTAVEAGLERIHVAASRELDGDTDAALRARGYQDHGGDGWQKMIRLDAPTPPPLAERPDLILRTTGPCEARDLLVTRDGNVVAHASTRMEGARLDVRNVWTDDAAGRASLDAALLQGALREAESAGATDIRIVGRDVQPHRTATRSDDGSWAVSVEDVRAAEEFDEHARRTAAARVADRFPFLGEPDAIAERIEMLPSARYEERVRRLADEAATRGRPWNDEQVEALCSPAVRGFVHPEVGRAVLRWDGGPGEYSTLFHEAFHLPLISERDAECRTPRALAEGYAEWMGAREAGFWDRMGPRDVTAEDGQAYSAVYVPADRWNRASDTATTVDVAGREMHAVVRANVAFVRVDASYPAATEAVSRIMAATGRESVESAIASGDAATLRAELDEYFGPGSFDAVVECLGSDPQGWYDPARVARVRELLSERH